MVIRSGISRIFPATMQKAAPGNSGAACRAYFSGSVLLVKTALAVKAGLGHGLCGVLELGGVVVHIQLAGDHAVVHLAALVGALAVVGFKVHVSGDSVHTGAVLLGGVLGALLSQRLPERIRTSMTSIFVWLSSPAISC